MDFSQRFFKVAHLDICRTTRGASGTPESNRFFFWCLFQATKTKKKTLWEALNFKAASVVYSWVCLMKISLLLIPEMAFHPCVAANRIAERCTKAPKQTGECHYLIYLWVIHGLFPFFPLIFCLYIPLFVSVCSTGGDVHIEALLCSTACEGV